MDEKPTAAGRPDDRPPDPPPDDAPTVVVSEKGVLLRTSARVSKKLRMTPSSTSPGPNYSKIGLYPTPLPFSCLPDILRTLLFLSFSHTVVPYTADSNDAPVFKASKKRSELWSAEETNAFFEGLNEFGKDYESIQWFMANKGKRKGACELLIKSKEQLRHFYYKTWHNICQYIEFPKGNRSGVHRIYSLFSFLFLLLLIITLLSFHTETPKVVQELYGLINYGELKKRVGFCNEKNWSKLYEMIYHGSTRVRSKGKMWRVKTPHCRALRKLNCLEGM